MSGFLNIYINAKPLYKYRRYVLDTRPYRDTEVLAICIGGIGYRPQDYSVLVICARATTLRIELSVQEIL